MVCCVCKQKQATVHLTQIVNDQMQKVDMCEACAKEKGLNDPAGFMIADMVLGLGAAQEIAQAAPGGGELACPACGFTQADFKKSGRLGCAECYETFAGGLDGLLKTMHKGTRHAGKTPHAKNPEAGPSEGPVDKPLDKTKQLALLHQRLEKALVHEDYEQAALLRDEIKALKKAPEDKPASE